MAFIETVSRKLKVGPRTVEIFSTDWMSSIRKMENWPNFCFFSVPTVKRCLQGVKAILPKEIAVQMLVKWYNAYNAPGGPNYHSEWNLFVTCLMNMMGYNTERLAWTRNVSKRVCLFS